MRFVGDDNDDGRAAHLWLTMLKSEANNGKLFMRIMYIYRTIIDSRVAQVHYELTNQRSASKMKRRRWRRRRDKPKRS